MISSSLKNSILALTLSALIAGVESQATTAPTCTPTSPQCCWVVRIWKLMGKTTNVSPTSSTACCSMTGVTCSGSSIIGINWESKSLQNSIPPSIGNLTSLQTVRLSKNTLTGPIPGSIRFLPNLKGLYLNSNALSGTIPTLLGGMPSLTSLNLSSNTILSGSLFVRCGLEVYYQNTKVTVSSDGNWASLPAGLPPAGTPAKCLLTNMLDTVASDSFTYSKDVGGNNFVFCTVDDNYNPTFDCMQYITYFCDPNKLAKGSAFISDCKSNLDFLLKKMNPHWRNYRKFCGNWAFTGTYTLPLSTTCASATNLLQRDALYNYGTIGAPFIGSVKSLLWDSPFLQN